MRFPVRLRWLLVGVIALAAISLIVVATWTPARAGNSVRSGVMNAGAPLSVGASPSNGAGKRPNIVFVLTDDLSMNLLKYMPQVEKMQREGMTFSNYTVTDSLCCPSRSSIFTGKFPHDTGVYTNNPPDGGFTVFHGRGNEAHTFATALQGRGYATGMMGKYLNGYLPGSKYVPPGWTEWDVSGKAYGEYRYVLNTNHTPVKYGSKPADYLTNVLSGKGRSFIERNAAAGTPFALEVATYAPHAPYTPARPDLNKFPGLKAPQTAAYDKLPKNAPAWLAGHYALTAAEKANIDTVFRLRVQAVQSVDRLIANLRSAVQSSGVADNTYFVFSSDNGYHLGEYRLMPGKQTAYETDIHVPLVVVGPGVPAGAVRHEVVQNIDLAPTFENLAGVQIPSNVDGHTLVPLLHGKSVSNWRNATLVEHHGPDTQPGDPDAQSPRNGIPPTYDALRTATYTYVEYANGAREFYDRVTDPKELDNIAGTLSAARIAALHHAIVNLRSCHTYSTCWAAGHVNVSPQL